MARMLTPLAVIASLAITAFPVMADLPPPPPAKGLKRVPYEHILKLETEISDYKFYAFQRLGLGGKETLGEALTLGTKTGVPVPSSSSPSVRTGIVAVPQKVMDELKTKENVAKLLYRDFDGTLPAGVVVYETFGTISDIPSKDPRTKVENVITISPDEKAGVKFTAKETAPKTSSGTSFGIWIASAAMLLSVLSLGFLIARGRLKSENKAVVTALAAS
jgi:hypothetical protein